MRRDWTIFLDDGGVLNDNRLRDTQWRRLLGEFFPPLLGGTPAAWEEANRAVTGRLFAADPWRARLAGATDYADFERDYFADWLGGMCALVGVEPPPSREVVDFGRRASAYVTQRVRAAFPGATEAIEELHAAGYPLYTASGTASADLGGYLDGMGVRARFRRLYGPDLVGLPKRDADYYRAIFADSGVDPATALVVDDSATALRWAAEANAVTVLVEPPAGGPRPTPLAHPFLAPTVAIHHRIANLSDLPALMDEIA